MKLAYERPMMGAELYQTNAYCNGCERDVDSQSWGVSKESSTYYTRVDLNWSNMSVGNDSDENQVWNETDPFVYQYGPGENDKITFEMEHTFDPAADKVTAGSCGDNNSDHSNSQSFWYCNCHDGRYMLELSHFWSNHVNTNNLFAGNSDYNQVFFLYYDVNDDGVFNIQGGSDYWPIGSRNDGNWTSDIAVSLVSPNTVIKMINS
ncbi:MAG: hypothetical protein IJ418_19280 [Clostridia bacterium]|nr:hypothetical protein [Clostridia bacterium]